MTLDQEVIVSKNAWKKGGAKSGGSTMYLEPESRVKIGDLIQGAIIQSANDACIALAENIAGSEEAFANLMTFRAREMGLKQATFTNATGLFHKDHKITVRELARGIDDWEARLSTALVKSSPTDLVRHTTQPTATETQNTMTILLGSIAAISLAGASGRRSRPGSPWMPSPIAMRPSGTEKSGPPAPGRVQPVKATPRMARKETMFWSKARLFLN